MNSLFRRRDARLALRPVVLPVLVLALAAGPVLAAQPQPAATPSAKPVPAKPATTKPARILTLPPL
ncbi:MAG TPA: hypothetical protein VI199_13965, partial [Novosphingobium sp.]